MHQVTFRSRLCCMHQNQHTSFEIRYTYHTHGRYQIIHITSNMPLPVCVSSHHITNMRKIRWRFPHTQSIAAVFVPDAMNAQFNHLIV